MTNQTYTLKAEPREITGRKVKQLRRDGVVPVVLYGHHVEPKNLTIARGELEKVYRKAGRSAMVTMKMSDGDQTVLIHEIQRDPRTGQYLHADLFQVKMDEKIKATVPIHTDGESPAVRELDGILVTNLNELEIGCLPGDLPSEIIVDLAALKTFEDAITVADLKIPEGVEVLSEAETNVVAVQPPKTEEQLEAELAEDEDTGEPEVEGEEDEEGEEGEEGTEGEGDGDSDDDAQSDDKGDDKKPDDSGGNKKADDKKSDDKKDTKD
ncbi:50S ribosomal protein L25 [Patescibacteria group bacterium]|nr:50S ribosomal protein L25 [Patescibacteria group bacterium]